MPQTQTADESLSLKDHEAQFSGRPARQPEAREPAPKVEADQPDLNEDAKAAAQEDFLNAADPMRQFRQADEEQTRPRHRAKGDRASADDVPTIQALTADLKAAEDELKALRPDAGAKESPRERNLRLKIRGIRAEIDEAKPKPAARVEARDETAATWDKKEPDFEDFTKDLAKYPDPYAAWLLAMGRHEREKEAFEAQHGQAAQARRTREAEQQVRQAFDQRRDAFKATHPDYERKWQAAVASGYDIPAVVTKVVLTDDNGPALMYSLLNSPSEMDALMDAYGDYGSAGKPITDGLTARVRRRLLEFHQRSTAGTTGAASTPTRTRTFTPPTPVRTTPIQTGEEPPDDERTSLADHEKHYNPRRRNGR